MNISTKEPAFTDVQNNLFIEPLINALKAGLEKTKDIEDANALLAAADACSMVAVLNFARARGGDRLQQIETVKRVLDTQYSQALTTILPCIMGHTSLIDLEGKPFKQTPPDEPLKNGMGGA